MLMILVAALFLPSVLSCVCSFPRTFTCMLKADSSSKDSIYNHKSNVTVDLTHHRVYMTPFTTSDASTEKYRVIDLIQGKVYIRNKDQSCTVHHPVGILFPDCVPSDYHKGGTVVDGLQEFRKYYNMFGRPFPAGMFKVKTPYTAEECTPIYGVVVPDQRHAVSYRFEFTNVVKMQSVDTSSFSLSGCN